MHRAAQWHGCASRGHVYGGVSPCPVGFKEGRVVDDGGEQGGEAPQQQGGEELGDDGVLQRDMAGGMSQVREGWWVLLALLTSSLPH